LGNALRAHLSVRYIQRFIGTPYRWGGDDPMAGFDCSGLAIEMLRSAGIFGNQYDNTAQGLAHFFNSKRTDKIKKGCLIFYGRGKITHVGIAVNSERMVEAGGAGGNCKTVADAIQYNAYVRERSINSRNDFVMAVDPF